MSQPPRMNRSAWRITSQQSSDQDWRYWLQQPLATRWEALEFLRQTFFGYHDQDSPRLQRVYRIAKRA